jgi:putative addiction module CopG family antidote
MTRPVDLPPDIQAFVDAQIAAGAYDSVDEAVRAAFDLLQERTEKLTRLKALLDEGYRSAREEPTCTVEEAIAEFDRMIAVGKRPSDA